MIIIIMIIIFIIGTNTTTKVIMEDIDKQKKKEKQVGVIERCSSAKICQHLFELFAIYKGIYHSKIIKGYLNNLP